MNSASKKGNGNIRSCIGFLIAFIIFILSISEFAPYANANFWIEPQFIETEIDCECHKGEECNE